jgi:hypothetical protein
MASLSDYFRFFGHATHLSLDDLVTGPLYFQELLKAGASKSRKGSNVTLWESAVPFIVSLGRATNPGINHLDAANLLISLNTLQIVCQILATVDPSQLPDAEVREVAEVVKAIYSILIRYNRDPFAGTKTQLPRVLADIEVFVSQTNLPRRDATQFAATNKNIVVNAKKVIFFVRKHFSSNISNTAQAPFIPLIYQMCLDLQVYGLLERMADRLAEFVTSQTQVLETVQAFFGGEFGKAAELFGPLASKFEKEAAARQGQGPFSAFCAACARLVGFSARQITNGLAEVTYQQHFVTFVVPPGEAVGFEFAQNICGLFQGYANVQPNHEVAAQIAQALAPSTQNATLRYICSAASFYPEQEIGYVALMGAFLPVEDNYRLTYFDTYTKLLASTFSAVDLKIRAAIIALNAQLDTDVVKAFNALKQVETVADAIASYVVLNAIAQVAAAQQKTDPGLVALLGYLGPLLTAWVVSLGSGLRSSLVAFVPAAIAAIEKHRSIPADQLAAIRASFVAVAVFSLDLPTPALLQELVEAASKCMLGIKKLVAGLIADKPISLAAGEPEFRALLSYGQIANYYFTALSSAFTPIKFPSPVFAAQATMALLQPLYGMMEPIPQYLESQPDQVTTLIMQVKLQAVAYLFALAASESTFNSKLVSDSLIQLTTSTDPAFIQNAVMVFSTELQTLHTQVGAAKVDQAALAGKNLTSAADLQQILTMIPNPILQAATLELFQLIEEDALESLVTDKRDALLEMLLFRINGYRQYELSKILKLSSEDLLAHSLAIFAPLPLYAMNFSKDVQRMALPLLLQQDKKSVRLALEKVVRFLTISIPLHQQIQILVGKLKAGQEHVNTEIRELLHIQGLNIDLCKSVNARKESIYNVALLYAEAQKGLDDPIFTPQFIDRSAKQISDTDNFDAIVRLTNEFVLETAAASIRAQCFELEILQHIREICENLRTFAQERSPGNKRALWGQILLVPPELKQAGEASQHWVETIAFATKEAVPILSAAVDDFVAVIGTDRQCVWHVLQDIPRLPLNVSYQRGAGDEERVRKHRHIHKHKHRDEHRNPVIKPPVEPPPPQHVRRVNKIIKKPEPIIVRKVVREVIKIKKVKQVEVEISEEELQASVKNVSAAAIRCVKLVETSRDVTQSGQLLIDALKMGHANLQDYLNDFAMRGEYLRGLINEGQDAGSQDILKSLTDALGNCVQLVQQIHAGDAS